MVIDDNNEVKSIDKFAINGVEEFKERITLLIEKENPQQLQRSGANDNTSYPVIFDGDIKGLNSDEIILSSDKTEITFPANKAIRISGYLGLLGEMIDGSGTGKPAYITSEFKLKEGGTGELIFSSRGYVESTSEGYDDGGVTFPVIFFLTGSEGATVSLYARYAGTQASSLGYLAGKPTATRIGTYIIVEEL